MTRLRLAGKEQPSAEQPAIDPAISVDADVTASGSSIAWKGVDPEEVSGEMSVQSLEKQHAEAVVVEQSLTARAEELEKAIAKRRLADEACAESAAAGNQASRSLSMELRKEIANLELDADHVRIALQRKKDRVVELFKAIDSALAHKQRGEAMAEAEKRLQAALAADKEFLASLVSISSAYSRLMTSVEGLRAEELAAACITIGARGRLVDFHDSQIDQLPSGIQNWHRWPAGPMWLSIIKKGAL